MQISPVNLFNNQIQFRANSNPSPSFYRDEAYCFHKADSSYEMDSDNLDNIPLSRYARIEVESFDDIKNELETQLSDDLDIDKLNALYDKIIDFHNITHDIIISRQKDNAKKWGTEIVEYDGKKYLCNYNSGETFHSNNNLITSIQSDDFRAVKNYNGFKYFINSDALNSDTDNGYVDDSTRASLNGCMLKINTSKTSGKYNIDYAFTYNTITGKLEDIEVFAVFDDCEKLPYDVHVILSKDKPVIEVKKVKY